MAVIQKKYILNDDAIDSRIQTEYTNEELKLWHLEGVIRTQIIMIEEGVLKL